MKQLICIFILFTGYTLTTKAQNDVLKPSIRGKVLTENGQPVEFANVALLLPDSTFLQGTCADGNGTFQITANTTGSYLLQISSIGYKTLCRPCTRDSAEEWILQTDAVMLDETVITATRPSFRLRNGRLETNVHQTLLSTLNNAHDVLKHIPGIRSSEEGYTVFGKGTPIIYIDNRLLQDNSELDHLSASDIDKVELITNPGAEYDATVKAVLRIRTIKGRYGGFGGNLRTSITQRRYTGSYEQVNANYQTQGLSLLGMLYANYENGKRSQEVCYQIPSEAQWNINSHVHLHNKGFSAGGKASISYDFNPKHSLGASYQFSRLPDYDFRDVSEYIVCKDAVPTDLTSHSSQTLQQSSRHQLNAYYQGTIGQLQVNLTTDIVYGNNYTHQEASETSRTEGELEISSFNRADSRLYAAKLIATHPIGAGTLKTGVDYTFIHRKDNFLNSQNVLPNTDSRIDESKLAGFSEYSLTVGKVNFIGGIRFEHAISDYWEQEQYIPEQSRIYNDWCPNLSIDFPIKNAQVSLSYTTKTNRPSFFQLRSSLSYNNRFIYEGGNPMLVPETNHDLQLSTIYKWLQFNLNYQYRKNAIAFMTKEYEENPDAVIFTTGNFKRMQYLTASLHLSPTIGIWKPELGVYFTQPFVQVPNQGSTRSMNRSSIYTFWQNSFSLPNEWVVSFDADYQSKGNFGAMLQSSYWGVDIGVRKMFLNKKLTLNLQANDLWNSRYSSFMLFGSKLTYTKKANQDSRSISLSISYRFNATGKAYKGQHVSDKDLQRL